MLKEALLKQPYIIPNILALSNSSSEETRFVGLKSFRVQRNQHLVVTMLKFHELLDGERAGQTAFCFFGGVKERFTHQKDIVCFIHQNLVLHYQRLISGVAYAYTIHSVKQSYSFSLVPHTTTHRSV